MTCVMALVRAGTWSYAERVSVRHPLARVRRKGVDRPGLVEPDVLVELDGEHGLEVVALQLRLGPVNYTDGALQTGRPQLFPDLGPGRPPQRKPEGRHAGLVGEPLVALRMR